MITEDYVSYEVAKLLKEKGFNEKCRTFYNDKTLKITYIDSPISNEKPFNLCLLAPTQSMAMKWLREVHNIFIQVDYIWSPKELYTYTFDIHNMKRARSIFSTPYGESFNSYEEVCEEAIKYCLTNLI